MWKHAFFVLRGLIKTQKLAVWFDTALAVPCNVPRDPLQLLKLKSKHGEFSAGHEVFSS